MWFNDRNNQKTWFKIIIYFSQYTFAKIVYFEEITSFFY